MLSLLQTPQVDGKMVATRDNLKVDAQTERLCPFPTHLFHPHHVFLAHNELPQSHRSNFSKCWIKRLKRDLTMWRNEGVGHVWILGPSLGRKCVTDCSIRLYQMPSGHNKMPQFTVILCAHCKHNINIDYSIVWYWEQGASLREYCHMPCPELQMQITVLDLPPLTPLPNLFQPQCVTRFKSDPGDSNLHLCM